MVAKDVMDIVGGKGIILGPRNFAGRAWQASPIAITVEGANIMTRSLMIFGQGAILCHPWVMKEMKAVQIADPNERLDAFDGALFGHIGYAISTPSAASGSRSPARASARHRATITSVVISAS